MTWRPTLGAWPEDDRIRFRLWAPRAGTVTVIVERAGQEQCRALLTREDEGYFGGSIGGARPGDRYRYVVDDTASWPDPASRCQPDGVHGSSEIVDPGRFPWSRSSFPGIPLERLVLYELHVGTFTREGTFAAARDRLPDLAGLGVTGVELMPVADFPGNRNWGYDGVSLFAPARCYGSPDDLRRFVDRAHALGLAVHLDVVFNHLGPDGAYPVAFSPYFFSDHHRSPWGAGINLDGPQSEHVRGFFIECALHWIHEYRLDGLRLDATHALVDESDRHFLAELSERVRATVQDRTVLLIAEDVRNLAHMVRPISEGGWGMDAVWSDDFHHQVRRLLAGDHAGYFVDFSGTVDDLATTVRQGWFYLGQYAPYFGRARGTDPRGIDARRFVFFIQNHDQVGNRARGDRLHHAIALAAYRAASTVCLLAPETPLLFMGQEWAASTPFQFFTDHAGELGERVRAGRAREFESFPEFSDPATCSSIPDPQSVETFNRSRLDWSEREREPHAHTLRLYGDLLRLRRSLPTLQEAATSRDARSIGDDTMLVRLAGSTGATILAISRLRGAGEVVLDPSCGAGPWRCLLQTEDPRYAPDPEPLSFEAGSWGLRVRFQRPGAAVLTSEPESDE